MPRLPSLSLSVLLLLAGPALAATSGSTLGESAEELVRLGRGLLEEGNTVEAQQAFERAVELDGSPQVRFWLVRGWIAQGRFEEAMLGADELRSAGAPAPDCDYLLGMAFLGAAKKAIAQGTTGAFTQDQLGDAYQLLAAATAADPLRFADAWLPRAEAGWYAQQLEGAREAVERAVELRPADAEAQTLRGRIAFSQFSALAQDDPQREACWQAALDSFRRAVELYGAADDEATRVALAEAHLQCGHLLAWKQEREAAATEYAQAMGWDPTRVDFAQVRSSLGEAFAGCVADGSRLFRERFGEDQPALATLAWWDGYARFEAGDWTGSESAFRTAVGLWPAYTNTWYYLFRLSYSQGEYAAAIDALQRFDEADGAGLVAMLSSSASDQVRVIDYLVGWCADPGQHDGRAMNQEAALLSDVLTRVQPSVSRHWNNLGLFLRDQGDGLRLAGRRLEGEGPDPEQLQRLWERAFEAYGRALELEPDNPNYVNDYAVMLHYYLLRDFDQARELYQRSQALAESALAREDLPDDQREVIAIALRDSKDNQRRLDRYLERVAAGEDVDPNFVR